METAEQFQGNVALVVIHRDHAVERAVPGSHEQRIARQRSADIDTRFTSGRDRWLNDRRFFVAKKTAVAGMRIERRDRHPRRPSVQPRKNVV
jgi:hypothetical protein